MQKASRRSVLPLPDRVGNSRDPLLWLDQGVFVQSQLRQMTCFVGWFDRIDMQGSWDVRSSEISREVDKMGSLPNDGWP